MHSAICSSATADGLIELFDKTFRDESTVLVANLSWPHDPAIAPASEPVFLPACRTCPLNRIVFAHGFATSALHEIAHWCIAGAARRRQVDYGYWYRPDGRSASEQHEFEKVEARPQAIEWAFSIAAGIDFKVSLDNLSGIEVNRNAFTQNVHAALAEYTAKGFPRRAQLYLDALCEAFARRYELPHV